SPTPSPCCPAPGAAARPTAPATWLGRRTTRSPPPRRPRWHGRWAGAWRTWPRGWRADGRLRLLPPGRRRAAGAGRAVRGLVPRRPPPAGLAAGVRPAAAAAGLAGVARPRPCRVLGGRACAVLVQPRGDGGLGAPGPARLGLGRDRAGAGRAAGRLLAGCARPLRHARPLTARGARASPIICAFRAARPARAAPFNARRRCAGEDCPWKNC